MHPPDDEARPRNSHVRHEPSDVNVRGVLAGGMVLALLAVIVHLGVWWLQEDFAGRELKLGLEPPAMDAPSLPEPTLELKPRVQLEQVRAEEQENLNATGWVDRDRRIVCIPIDKAIDIIANDGLPDFNQAEGQR